MCGEEGFSDSLCLLVCRLPLWTCLVITVSWRNGYCTVWSCIGSHNPLFIKSWVSARKSLSDVTKNCLQLLCVLLHAFVSHTQFLNHLFLSCFKNKVLNDVLSVTVWRKYSPAGLTRPSIFKRSRERLGFPTSPCFSLTTRTGILIR